MDNDSFSIPEVAEAAGLKVETLRTWVKRREIPLTEEQFLAATPGRGRARAFSRCAALSIAITAALVDLGVPISHAGRFALLFTDSADASGGWVGGPVQERNREPGELVKGAVRTILLVEFRRAEPGAGLTPHMRVIPGEELNERVFLDAAAVIALHVDPIFHRVAALRDA